MRVSPETCAKVERIYSSSKDKCAFLITNVLIANSIQLRAFSVVVGYKLFVFVRLKFAETVKEFPRIHSTFVGPKLNYFEQV
jgi:hypothetical protein